MRQITKDPQATQINLLKHQRTELPPNKAQRKQFKKNKFRSKTWGIQMKSNIKHLTRKMSMKTRRNSTQDRFFKVKTDVTNVETSNT